MMNHQSDQIKTRKYYRYCLENANFSKFSGKGHKAKDQILKLSNASLWNEYSGILLFLVIFYGFTRARTLMHTLDVLFGQVSTFLKDSTIFVYGLGGF